MARLSKETIAAAKKYGPTVDDIARQYHISGAALLAKLVSGESSDNPAAVSPAGARDRAQFMPGSRDIAIQKYGVDPWSGKADDAVHAAALHLRGLINGSKGLEGYNPGSPTYTSYILGQKVGSISGGSKVKRPSSPAAPASSYAPGTPAVPGVDNSGLRRQLVGQFLQQGGIKNSNAVLGLAAQYGQAADVPGVTTTQGVRNPTQPSGSTLPSGKGRAGGSKVLELIYNDGGKGYGIKDGRTVNGSQVFDAVWAGHANHVHVAAGPKTVVALGKYAQKLGLHVGENSHFGGENPASHVPGSYHNKDEAIDVSGDAALMARFARAVAAYNRSRRLPGNVTVTKAKASSRSEPSQSGSSRSGYAAAPAVSPVVRAPRPVPPAPAPAPAVPLQPGKERLCAHPQDQPGAAWQRRVMGIKRKKKPRQRYGSVGRGADTT